MLLLDLSLGLVRLEDRCVHVLGAGEVLRFQCAIFCVEGSEKKGASKSETESGAGKIKIFFAAIVLKNYRK